MARFALAFTAALACSTSAWAQAAPADATTTNTTDTTAALRAVEIDAEVMLRGTHSGVQGIYSDDPRTNPDARLLDELGYVEIINQGLKAMDPTSVTLCMENRLPIVVFDLMTPGNLRSILEGERIGTLVH